MENWKQELSNTDRKNCYSNSNFFNFSGIHKSADDEEFLKTNGIFYAKTKRVKLHFNKIWPIINEFHTWTCQHVDHTNLKFEHKFLEGW